MRITCDVVKDLLPLYAEDMVSSDSKALVDNHLCSCDACVKVLADIRKQEPIPVEIDTKPLNNVKRMIVRRRALAVMASIFTLLTLASLVVTFLFSPFQLTKEQALDDFYVREDGAVVIDYSSAVVGRSLSGFNENWFINQYSTRYDTWKGENRKSIEAEFGTDGVITEEERRRYENIDVIYGTWQSADGSVKSDAPIPGMEGVTLVSGGNDWNWWYADPTGLGRDTLLYDAGKEMPDQEERYQFAPVYPMIFFGGIAAALVLLILRKFIKRIWIKEFCTRIVILCISGVFSTLLVSSGRIFTSYVGVIDQYWGWMIGTNTAFLTLTTLFWRQLHLLNKRDRGE